MVQILKIKRYYRRDKFLNEKINKTGRTKYNKQFNSFIQCYDK